MPLTHLEIGQLCAARYSGTGEWHRCYIVEVFQKQVEVTTLVCLIFICIPVCFAFFWISAINYGQILGSVFMLSSFTAGLFAMCTLIGNFLFQV